MRIVLIGFMGSGKSTVARLISERTGIEAIEMDELVRRRSGRGSIAEIFHEDGEEHFRSLEQAVAADLALLPRAVVSSGGGIVTRETAIGAFKSAGFTVVHLACDFEVSWSRAGGDPARPLFASEERARALFDERLPLYRRHADLIIEAGDVASGAVCDRILESMPR